MPTGQSDGGSPSVEIPFARYAKWTTKINHHRALSLIMALYLKPGLQTPSDGFTQHYQLKKPRNSYFKGFCLHWFGYSYCVLQFRKASVRREYLVVRPHDHTETLTNDFALDSSAWGV